MNIKTNEKSKRNLFPKTVRLADGLCLSRFSFKKLPAYRQVTITPEQSECVACEPLKTLRRVLTGLGQGKLYLIERGGEVCGYIALWMQPKSGRFVIAPMIIDKSAQGRGMGRAVLDRVCKMMFDAGAQSIALAVHPDNSAAIGLYESMGFAFTGGE